MKSGRACSAFQECALLGQPFLLRSGGSTSVFRGLAPLVRSLWDSETLEGLPFLLACFHSDPDLRGSPFEAGVRKGSADAAFVNKVLLVHGSHSHLWKRCLQAFPAAPSPVTSSPSLALPRFQVCFQCVFSDTELCQTKGTGHWEVPEVKI